MRVKFGKRFVDVKVRKLSFFQQFMGLMFKSRNSENLLFEFGKRNFGIHSFFVFFRFLAVWLDENDFVVGVSVVRPFTIFLGAKKNARKLIEIPFNDGNREIIRFFVDKGKV